MQCKILQLYAVYDNATECTVQACRARSGGSDGSEYRTLEDTRLPLTAAICKGLALHSTAGL